MLQWTRYRTVTAAACLAGDQLDEAYTEIEEGTSAATERTALGYHPPLLRLRAEWLAQRHLTDVATIFRELRMPLWLDRTELALG